MKRLSLLIATGALVAASAMMSAAMPDTIRTEAGLVSGAAGATTADVRVFKGIPYGAGFTGGAGSEHRYDGEALARHGAVVVTYNYRLGAFGWFAHPGLTKESGHNASGNYGLMDAVAALKWVQKNIASFGGDPRNV